jgi:MoxR-like ATPase
MSCNTIVSVSVGRPLLDVLHLCFEARLAVVLIGGTGIGKSTIIEDFAKMKRLDFLCRDLSLMEPPDLVGMPEISEGKTRFCPPATLPTGGKGILVLEEINRAPEYMRSPCLQLLTARCLNDYRLPDGWLPVACINPAEDGYQAAELDPALLTRFVRIVVIPDRAEWIRWARPKGIESEVIAYVDSDPSVFNSPISNPRSWVQVSQLLRANRELSITSELLQVAVAGCVGAERATAFFKFLKRGIAPLAAETILKSYRTQRKTVRAWITEGHLDYVAGTLLNLRKHLQSETEFDAVRKHQTSWRNLGQFLNDLPGDLRDQAEEFFRERDYPLPPRPRRSK